MGRAEPGPDGPGVLSDEHPSGWLEVASSKERQGSVRAVLLSRAVLGGMVGFRGEHGAASGAAGDGRVRTAEQQRSTIPTAPRLRPRKVLSIPTPGGDTLSPLTILRKLSGRWAVWAIQGGVKHRRRVMDPSNRRWTIDEMACLQQVWHATAGMCLAERIRACHAALPHRSRWAVQCKLEYEKLYLCGSVAAGRDERGLAGGSLW